MYTRLNHLSLTLSYNATLKIVQQISELRKVPISEWLKEGAPVKFVGDNVDKKKGVRDVRSDHQSKMHNMYSLLAVKGRVAVPDEGDTEKGNLKSFSPSSFLPNKDDVLAIRHNLKVLVARILCKYISCLSPLSKQVPAHINHEHSEDMAKKSEFFFLDVLMKNEAVHADMVDIMQCMQDYLGKDSSPPHKILSGGDQLTCERQVGAQCHRMDGNTPRERLQLVEPQCEDWHTLMCFLKVCVHSLYKCTYIYTKVCQ